MAFLPRPALEVRRQCGHAAGDHRRIGQGETRAVGPHGRVQVGLGPAASRHPARRRPCRPERGAARSRWPRWPSRWRRHRDRGSGCTSPPRAGSPASSQKEACWSKSMPRTRRRGATRHISAKPAAQSSQWCTVRMAMATSAQAEGSGRADPLARTAGPEPWARWLIITLEGSTARTDRPGGS